MSAIKALGVLLISVAAVVFLYYTAWTILLPLGLIEESFPGLAPYLSVIFPPKEYATTIPAAILAVAVLVVALFISYINFKHAKKKKSA
jgi:dolichyl-phosphate mannosyltransferase polypeptide 2 regulatory subunit